MSFADDTCEKIQRAIQDFGPGHYEWKDIIDNCYHYWKIDKEFSGKIVQTLAQYIAENPEALKIVVSGLNNRGNLTLAEEVRRAAIEPAPVSAKNYDEELRSLRMSLSRGAVDPYFWAFQVFLLQGRYRKDPNMQTAIVAMIVEHAKDCGNNKASAIKELRSWGLDDMADQLSVAFTSPVPSKTQPVSLPPSLPEESEEAKERAMYIRKGIIKPDASPWINVDSRPERFTESGKSFASPIMFLIRRRVDNKETYSPSSFG